jgi:hypothetical protein
MNGGDDAVVEKEVELDVDVVLDVEVDDEDEDPVLVVEVDDPGWIASAMTPKSLP